MSSQLRRLAQAPAHSPARAKFFLSVAAIGSGSGTAGDAIASLNPTTILPAEAVINTADFGNIFDQGTAYGSTGTLFRDLGRSVTVVDNDGNHLYRYRQVQQVSGVDTEGVGGTTSTTAPQPWTSNLYVLVWAANGSANVSVVRTG